MISIGAVSGFSKLASKYLKIKSRECKFNPDWDEDSIMDWFYDNANIVDEAISYGELVDEETHNHSDTDYDLNTENGADLHNIIEAIENEQ